MRKPKFSIGQTVHISRDEYTKDTTGKIKRIVIAKETIITDKGEKTNTRIIYTMSNGFPFNYHESKLFDSKSDLYIRKRRRAKSGIKSGITRSEKTLKKNEEKLAQLQEKLKKLG